MVVLEAAMDRHPNDSRELLGILAVTVFSMILISLLDLSGADISHLSVLTVIFALYLAVMVRRKNLS
jgi:hypothetical protein